MELSILLAKVVGFYWVIIALALLVHSSRCKAILRDMINNDSILFLGGIVALIIGLLMVASHNIWVLNWQGLVTIAGWAALIKGVSILFTPQITRGTNLRFLDNKNVYTVTSVIVLFLGMYLIYSGFSYREIVISFS